jgi:hypothetical protein
MFRIPKFVSAEEIVLVWARGFRGFPGFSQPKCHSETPFFGSSRSLWLAEIGLPRTALRLK